MKYFLLTVSSLIATFVLSGCASAMPNAINGKYYMAGDSNCKRYRQILDDRIMCIDSDGRDTGYRDAMSDQELQMYHYKQVEESAAQESFNQSMNNLSNQMRQNAYNTQQSAYQLQQMNNQTYQRQQDKKTNYQLQQINNNLNNIRYGY
jgi:hypothetical protein